MWKSILALLVVMTLPAKAETLIAQRLDGTSIQIWVERADTKRPAPVVLAVDGSLCTPEESSEWIKWLAAQRNGAHPYTLVVVKKPSPTVPDTEPDGSYRIGPDFHCSDDFKQHYTLDQRVQDHLQALAYLRRFAPWWNRELLIWGFSDGAHIGARVGVYSPETKAQVLVGLGGGTSMAVELQNMMCSEPKSAASCRSDYQEQLKKIRENPTFAQSWLGETNTYAVWKSRLDSVDLYSLQYSLAPVLLIHGSKDGSMPVQSARVLGEKLAPPKGPVEYKEVEGMNHGLGSGLPPAQATELQESTLQWLLRHVGSKLGS